MLSGRTVEELRDGRDLAAPIRAELDRSASSRRSRSGWTRSRRRSPRRSEAPFTREGWLFELKLDGYRILAELTDGEVKLLTRRGNDANPSFPEIVRAMSALPYRHVIIDGEVIAADEEGRPSFQRLQRAPAGSVPPSCESAALENPVTFYAFDLIAFEDRDLRGLPLIERKRMLRELLPPAGAVHYLDHFEKEGERDLRRGRAKMGLEGLVAKKASSPYRGGRTETWLKIRSDRTGDFVVVGFTAPKGSRTGLGALHLADFVDGKLTYAGSGRQRILRHRAGEVCGRNSRRCSRLHPPCVGPVPNRPDTRWIEPDAGLRGALQGMDRRGAAPPSGVRPLA